MTATAPTGTPFTWPSSPPNGSRDPFYIKIDKLFEASDHVTYMQRGIPSVMFITWPDPWSYSSPDKPDTQAPTQYTRAAVVGIGAVAVLATGGRHDQTGDDTGTAPTPPGVM